MKVWVVIKKLRSGVFLDVACFATEEDAKQNADYEWAQANQPPSFPVPRDCWSIKERTIIGSEKYSKPGGQIGQ